MDKVRLRFELEDISYSLPVIVDEIIPFLEARRKKYPELELSLDISGEGGQSIRLIGERMETDAELKIREENVLKLIDIERQRKIFEFNKLKNELGL